jgi:hypothetical protein
LAGVAPKKSPAEILMAILMALPIAKKGGSG